MNIFSTMKQTPYIYYKRVSDNTWSGNGASEKFNSFGVFKPRNTASLPNANPDVIAEPTLNIKVSERFIERKKTSKMIGDKVTVPSFGGTTYVITGVTTAKNFRTGAVAHYRLHLQEEAE